MPFLEWVNKNQAKEASREVLYHLLKQESVYGDNAENLLIQGDNLLALKALIPFYAGRVKCIFIDPPYNTQSAFAHYDDKLEHSQWLSMMYPRLVLLRDLLAEDGSIWVTIDDNEAHYLKALMDEVFGRRNFLANVVWQKFHSVKTNAQYNLSSSHDHILVYRRSEALQDFCLLEMGEEALQVYKNQDNDPRGLWRTAPLTVSLLGGQRGASYAKTGQSNGLYEIVAPNGKKHFPGKGRCWLSRQLIDELISDNKIWWGKDGNAVPMKKLFLSEQGGKKICNTFWLHTEVGSNKAANEEQKGFFPEGGAFTTPKPERLLERIIHLASTQGDLVLDSFLGSGTTSAVAQKMNRRYIGIEMGDHAVTHCIPRLQKVIAGEQGGISAAVSWQGGGGFRFCTLGEAAFDEHGRINAAVKFATLAAFVWHFETGIPSPPAPLPQAGEGSNTPLLGIHNGTAYYLLYNGILGDRKPSSGNVLTHAVLQAINDICPYAGRKVIYGETTRLGAARLASENIVFKQIPYDVKMR